MPTSLPTALHSCCSGSGFLRRVHLGEAAGGVPSLEGSTGRGQGVLLPPRAVSRHPAGAEGGAAAAPRRDGAPFVSALHATAREGAVDHSRGRRDLGAGVPPPLG